MSTGARADISRAHTTGALVRMDRERLAYVTLYRLTCLRHAEQHHEYQTHDARYARAHPEEWCRGCAEAAGYAQDPDATDPRVVD